MLKNLFNIQILPFFNPFIHDEINRMGDYSGVNNDFDREYPLIVSIYSVRENFKNLPITLYSLLNQSLKPDRIVLWLDEETEDLTTLPYEITRFVKNGLEIKFVKDIKQYTKTVYALKEFQNSIVVTACDNVYYRRDWLKKLYYSYIVSPNDIHIHKAFNVNVKDNLITPFKEWKLSVSSETAKYVNFPISSGGVLYPPKCFKNEVFRSDIFLKYVPNNDDIWFWIMALTNNKKFRVVKNHDKSSICLNIFDCISKMKAKKKSFDSQTESLMKFYGQNVIGKL